MQRGCNAGRLAAAQRAEAVIAAKSADAVIAFVGLSPDVEGEEPSIVVPGFDRGDRNWTWLAIRN